MWGVLKILSYWDSLKYDRQIVKLRIIVCSWLLSPKQFSVYVQNIEKRFLLDLTPKKCDSTFLHTQTFSHKWSPEAWITNAALYCPCMIVWQLLETNILLPLLFTEVWFTDLESFKYSDTRDEKWKATSLISDRIFAFLRVCTQW